MANSKSKQSREKMRRQIASKARAKRRKVLIKAAIKQAAKTAR